MKTATFLLLPKFIASGGGALFKSNNVFLSILCLIVVTPWSAHSITVSPDKFDSLDSTFPLGFQPPVFEASHPHGRTRNGFTTIDSYGNPIGSLQPIQTPDGRKVVSAQGLQFEIPNYASGITELKKPDDDLLPPFVGEFSNDFDKRISSRDDVGLRNYDWPGSHTEYKDRNEQARESLQYAQTILANDEYEGELQLQDIRRVKRQPPQHSTDTNNNNNNNNNNGAFNNNDQDEVLKTQTVNSITQDNNQANTTPRSMNTLSNKRQDQELITNPIPSTYLENNLNFSILNFESSKIISPHSFSPSYTPRMKNNTSHLPSSKTKLSAHFIPLSNGNFNYPNLPTDASIIERLVYKYKNPLPTLDPIVVALPNAGPESFKINSGVSASAEQTTSIATETVPIVKLIEQAAGSHNALASRSQVLPDYIVQLNDPDIGGPVDYQPTGDKRGSNVIAWDLLPPWEAEITDEKSFSHNRITTGHNLNAEASQESSQITQMPQLGLGNSIEPTHLRNSQGQRGASYYTSTTTTPRTTKPRTTTTTPRTTTARTTTTARSTTTTTRRTTTPRTTTTTTTTPAPDSTEFFKLEAGDSYTLPSWLQDIDDPDLDVAVTFEIPEDINEYNHTVERDLLAPLEPFTDLKNLHLTPPTNHPEVLTTTATTTTTTTTRRPTQSTYQPHWVRAKPTTPKPTVATINKQFTSLHPSITSSTNFAQRTTSTTTTTNKPKSSITFNNRQISSNTAQIDTIGSSSSSEEDNRRSGNPFLSKFNNGKYNRQQINRRTTTTPTITTTTTTTTTPAPQIIEKNPFEGTLPAWLKDFDYPDLGPAVPFVYNPNDDENPLDKNILPPTKSEEDPNPATKPISNSPFLNTQKPKSFQNKFSTSALSLTSSSSIPSITIIPFPSAQQTNPDDSTFTRQPVVFVPPNSNSAAEGNDDILKKTSTTFDKHFPAPFESTGSTTSDQNKVPLSADRESFPPFNNIITGSSTVPSKTTFSKSEDGKVITNGGIGSTSSKPIGSSQAANSQDKNSLTTQSATGTTLTTSPAVSAFVTSVGNANEGGKYTGHFGGPILVGALAPNVNGFTAASTTATKSINTQTSRPTAVTNNNDRFTGSFGGPPGILKPYDNVKNR